MSSWPGAATTAGADLHRNARGRSAYAQIGGVRTDPLHDLARRFIDHHGTLRGVVRHVLVARQLGRHLPPPPARILDVGGGAGQQGLLLAAGGYQVTVLDPSVDTLGRAKERAREFSPETAARISLVEGRGEDAEDLFSRGTFDATLCHGLQIHLEDPRTVLYRLVVVTRPGGAISLLAKNADTLALRPALEGRWNEAAATFQADPAALGSVVRGETVEGLTRLFDTASVDAAAWYGVGVLTDHLGDEPAGGDLEAVLRTEWEAGRRDPYRSVARLIHLIGRKRRPYPID